MHIFVSAWVGSSNLGDELIFAALRQKLTKCQAKIAVLSVDPQSTKRIHGVSAVPHNDISATFSAIKRSDALVFGGGGLLQDETSWFNLPYHLSRIWLSRMQQVPFCVVGAGVGPLTRIGSRLVSKSFQCHSGISVRDEASASMLTSLGVKSVVVAADLALSLPDVSVPVHDRLVVCLRPWSPGSRWLPVSMKPNPNIALEIFVDKMAAALDEISGSSGLRVHFVAFQAGRDDLLHERIASRMRFPSTSVAPPLKEIVKEVAKGQVVVGMRYHAGIAAVLSGRPVVLIGYSQKVESLAAELGAGGVLLQNNSDALKELPKAVELVSGCEDAVIAARCRLRQRELGNDKVLDSVVGR